MSSTVNPHTFRSACAKFATGIAVATVLGPDGEPHGLTVNSFTSVSLDPPLVLICVDYASAVLPLFRASTHYGINVLSETQRDLSVRFAQKGQNRFGGVAWTPGHSGVPRLIDTIAFLECSVEQTIEAGDHAIFIACVEHVALRDDRPLLYFNSAYHYLR